jgi:regulator of sigma E protease
MSAEKLLLFLIMLSVLVVFHEYGHFLLARRNGVRVNDFAVGMGPTLLKWTSPRSGTNYRLNLFPIGGYCAMKGEDGKSNEAEQQREFRRAGDYDHDNFQAKSPWQRLAIVVAGPIANFLIAIVLLVASFAIFGLPTPSLRVGPVTPNMPAARAGIHEGDTIVAAAGQPLVDGDQLVKAIQRSLGKPLQLSVDHAGTTRKVTVVPVAGPDGRGHTVGVIGFVRRFESRPAPFGKALAMAGDAFTSTFSLTLGALGGLVTHPSETVAQIQGPIGIARVSAEVQDFGWGPYLGLAATLSISLGIFNLLPIPALDGGRGIFILVEMLRGKPIDPEKEALVHVGGFAALIMVMLLVSYHDIARIVAGKAAF